MTGWNRCHHSVVHNGKPMQCKERGTIAFVHTTSSFPGKSGVTQTEYFCPVHAAIQRTRPGWVEDVTEAERQARAGWSSEYIEDAEKMERLGVVFGEDA